MNVIVLTWDVLICIILFKTRHCFELIVCKIHNYDPVTGLVCNVRKKSFILDQRKYCQPALMDDYRNLIIFTVQKLKFQGFGQF